VIAGCCRAILLAGVAACPVAAQAASCMDADPQVWLTDNGQRALYKRLAGYLVCVDDPVDGPLADRSACNYFTGRVLSDEWGINDFARAGGGWLTANEIAAQVAHADSGWTRIGLATSQASLTAASAAADAGDAVIAVRSGNPGHIALILPGAPQRSNGWGLNVPNSASFSLDQVDAAYVFCRLSYAFGSAQGVNLYRKPRQP
jgi:hypothetical protein